MGSFVKNIDEIKKYSNKPTTFYNAEILSVYWETDINIIKRILPPPLKPAKKPLINAFLANYPRTNFCPGYKEAALFVLSEYNGKLGTYCLSMPITDDMAMGLGREYCGFPKKIANIEFNKDNNIVEGFVERHGIKFFNIKAKLNTEFNCKEGQTIIKQFYEDSTPIYNIKYSKSVDGKGFDLNPILVQQYIDADINEKKYGNFEIILNDSPHDPWSELEVVKPLGCTYTVGTTILLRGTNLEKINPEKFIPYSYIRWDWWRDSL